MKTLLSIIIIIFLSLAGCIPPQERRSVETPDSSSYIVPAPIVPANLLDKKIEFLEGILHKDTVSDKDRKLASNLLHTYYSIKDSSQKSEETTDSLNAQEYRRIILALFRCLSDLDDNYFTKPESSPCSHTDSMSYFHRKKYQILNAYLEGDFKGAINHCTGMKELFGADALSEEIDAVCALSLAKEGMIEEALKTGHAAANKLESFPDPIQLRSEIAEWDLMLGQRKRAAREFKKLTDMIKGYRDIVKTLGEKIALLPKTQKIPALKTDTRVELSMPQFLKEVEDLIQKHNFSEARELLVLKSMGISSKSDVYIIDQALRNLEMAEEKHLESKISDILKKNETADSARDSLQEEKLEKTSSGLDAPASEAGKTNEATELKEEAIESLINRERNRAARIFLTAKKTEDPEKKEEYLQDSYDILKELIEKYPESPLNQKLKSHIKTVEEEINKLEKASSPSYQNHKTPGWESNH
ncbi:MAG TPA: hypothetical protein PK874_12730 [Desulfobacteraceae bacterium]|nr:hypothetical protein [Desulfobacteraceae bacterium]HPJ68772.1 hypothetical protein [Desulfobacteraceae bacterium]HPQ28607.1 hypothetical protein [Desulfobacteraceae bacterium]